jgi:hypothetical protein
MHVRNVKATGKIGEIAPVGLIGPKYMYKMHVVIGLSSISDNKLHFLHSENSVHDASA